ncbi:MAG: long-chain fatty acid--CoA ligase [Kiloniellales bacterium]
MDYTAWSSLPQMLFERASVDPKAPVLWSKRDDHWQSLTWGELDSRVRNLAKALIARGIQPGDRILLACENRPEWTIAHFAIMSCGAITVPAYTTHTEHDYTHLLEDSGAVAALISSAALGERCLAAMAKAAACRFAITLEAQQTSLGQGQALLDWQAEEAAGAQAEVDLEARLAALERDAACIFIYTSGTGGTPKGVMLSHGNIFTNCGSAFDLLSSFGVEEVQQTFLSFLPLSHSYEHAAGLCFPLTIRAQIYYAESVEKLAANMAEVQPTLMTAVPRLYESMRQRILAGLKHQPPLRQKLFHKTVELGLKRNAGERLGLIAGLQDKLLERLVREKVRQRFGGRLQALVSGGAALNPDIGNFFQALGLTLLQGYGQTESAPVVSCNRPDKVKMTSVGPPLDGVKVKIAEDGEILVQGGNVMLGYWRAPEATAAVIRDGWLHTGDVGHLDEDGYIYITDRKKDILVVSGGDNVSPARLEGLLTLEAEIEQACVVGDRKPYLVALIVPSKAAIEAWAKEKSVPADLARLAKDPAFHQRMAEVVGRTNDKLSVIERIRRFAIASEGFTIDNEMMTPTMKTRRHKILAAYGPALEALYQKKGAA